MSKFDDDIHALSSDIMNKGYWWACTRPESPPDIWVAYSKLCKACMLAAKLAVHTNTAVAENSTYSSDSIYQGSQPLSDWIEQ